MVHATTVAVEGAGLLIRGPSGSGKSGLGLQLLALGAALVSDDRTLLSRPDSGAPLAEAPKAISGLIEARGLGLIEVTAAGASRVAAILDLAETEDQRMPSLRRTELLGFPLPLLHRVESPSFPAALLLWLRTVAAR